MPLLPYDYLHLVNCPEVVTISDILCSNDMNLSSQLLQIPLGTIENDPAITTGSIAINIPFGFTWSSDSGAWVAVVSYKGASIYDVPEFLGFFYPSPLVRTWNWSTVLNSHNLPYYIFFWANPPFPLSANVMYECPLSWNVIALNGLRGQSSLAFFFSGNQCSLVLHARWSSVIGHHWLLWPTTNAV